MSAANIPEDHGKLSVFSTFLSALNDSGTRDVLAGLLRWVHTTFPGLIPIMAWNQPMFSDHGTFIIGFSVAKKHFSVAPEKATMAKFAEEIRKAGYDQTPMLFRIGWSQKIDYRLMEEMIRFNIEDKKDVTTFWR